MAAASPIDFLFGSDEFAVKKATESLTTRIAPEDEFNFEVIDAAVDDTEGALQRIRMLREALLTLPFGFCKKVIWWKNVSFLGDTVTGKSASVLEALEGVLPLLEKIDGQSLHLVISAIGVDKRRTFFKKLSALAKTEVFDLPDEKKDPEEAILQIENLLKSQGMVPEEGVPERIFEVLGMDPRAWNIEIDKLACGHEGLNPKVTLEEVKIMIHGNREVVIWDFCDAVITGNVKAALQLLQPLCSHGGKEVGLVILLGNQIRQAALISTLIEEKMAKLSGGGRFSKLEVTTAGEALLPRKKSGETTNLFVLTKIAEKAKRKPAAFWRQAVDRLYQTHRQLLTTGGEKRLILEQFVISLT
ncbi:MAG: hypothetical protein V4507_16215 [Verrucomicrobiota bacterium]